MENQSSSSEIKAKSRQEPVPRNDSIVGTDCDEEQDEPERNHHPGPVRVADQLDPRDGGVVEHGGGGHVDD